MNACWTFQLLVIRQPTARIVNSLGYAIIRINFLEFRLICLKVEEKKIVLPLHHSGYIYCIRFICKFIYLLID